MSALDSNKVEMAAREIAKVLGLDLAPNYDLGGHLRLANRDALQLIVRLPRADALVEFEARHLFYGTQHAFEVLQQKLSDAGAALRGCAMREMLDGTQPIDWTANLASFGIADPEETPYERAERMAVRLAEESERLMKLAAELRSAA